MILKILAGLAARKIRDRISRSATAAAAGGIAATGIAAWADPELLELIPEQYRGYVIMAVGFVVLLARVRKEIVAAIREARNG